MEKSEEDGGLDEEEEEEDTSQLSYAIILQMLREELSSTTNERYAVYKRSFMQSIYIIFSILFRAVIELLCITITLEL